jgi:hypothetical protein
MLMLKLVELGNIHCSEKKMYGSCQSENTYVKKYGSQNGWLSLTLPSYCGCAHQFAHQFEIFNITDQTTFSATIIITSAPPLCSLNTKNDQVSV